MQATPRTMDTAGSEALATSGYCRPGRMDAAASYTMEDVAGGFREGDRRRALPRPGVLRMTALSMVMLMFPVAVLGYLLVLGLLVGAGIDAIRVGAARNDPMFMSGAIIVVVGAVALMMRLIYRLMAEWRRRYVNLHLRKQEYPVLYRFVGIVAGMVDATPPSVITVDNEVGLLLRQTPSGKGTKTLELVIGLPLLYSLSARQLSGLIAHAYGGFSASGGRFGYPLISNINRWLVRMSDGEASRQYDASHHRLTVGLLAPADWAIGSFFAVLSWLAGVVSFSMSRRMDIQGDFYSARLAGASEFRSTQLRLRALHLGKRTLLDRLNAGFVPESSNVSRMVAEEAESIQQASRHQLVREMEDLVGPQTRGRVVDLGRIIEVEKGQDEGECFLLGQATRLVPHVDLIGNQIGAKFLGAQGRGL
jgi:hypothetical protein